jgi:hypothetical protein
MQKGMPVIKNKNNQKNEKVISSAAKCAAYKHLRTKR